MKLIFVIIWIVVILFLAVPIFLYGAFGQPWLTMNAGREVANGQVSGIILRSQTWRGEVLVSGDIYVAPWAQLQIEPGTVIKIAVSDDQDAGPAPVVASGLQLAGNDPTATRDYARSHISISGRIQALGKVSEPINFVSAEAEPGYAAWQGLEVQNNSVLHNTNISNAQTGIITSGTVHLERVVVSEMLWDCLRVRRGQARVENSEFSYCWQRGIAVLDESSPILRANTISNSQIGLAALENSSPQIKGNEFKNNAVAIFLETTGEALVVTDNEMSSPVGPEAEAATYQGEIIYTDNWKPGSGEDIVGTNLL